MYVDVEVHAKYVLIFESLYQCNGVEFVLFAYSLQLGGVSLQSVDVHEQQRELEAVVVRMVPHGVLV